ncbi:MAG: insulinase family protein [Syntrophomonadaceae bacterium]|nr:insulinase family protein [Syntrophomonadaceae bacterium]
MINSWECSNGAKLVVEDIDYLRSAAVGVYIKVGSRHENPGLMGASHLIEHMLFKGTPSLTACDIAEKLEGMGGQLNAYTGKEYTCVYARTLDEDIFEAMDIVFDMLFNSCMSPQDLDTEREVVMEEINTYEDTPDELIHDVFARQYWAGHPMGNPILGSLESVGNMDREAMITYYRSCYVPANMVIAVAGNVDNLKVRDYLEDKLKDRNGSVCGLADTKPVENSPFITLVPKEVEQIQICLGVPGLSYLDDERYTQTVLNSILGAGMSSRLFQKLREELGLAYSVYSYPATYSDTGLFSMYIGTSRSKVAQFCAVLNEEIERFVVQGVTADEILRTQKLTKSSIAMSLESAMNRMTRLGKSMMMYDRIISPEEVIAKISQVTPEMVQELAARLLRPELFAIAAIGDERALPLVETEYKKWWGHK